MSELCQTLVQFNVGARAVSDTSLGRAVSVPGCSRGCLDRAAVLSGGRIVVKRGWVREGTGILD